MKAMRIDTSIDLYDVYDADEAPKEGEKEKGEESHCHHQQFNYHNLIKLNKKPMKSKHYLDKKVNLYCIFDCFFCGDLDILIQKNQIQHLMGTRLSCLRN
jgi:hypothetical protein